MALFDKLSGIARNLGDKASEAIETTKLNSKISTEKNAIADCMRQIGEYYYQKHQTGAVDEPDLAELFATIDGHHQTITETQAEINRLQEESALQRQMAQSAPISATVAPVFEGVPCPACGAANTPGTNFCIGCGSKLAMQAPEPEPELEYRTCPECGAQVSLESRFCGECGYRFEA